MKTHLTVIFVFWLAVPASGQEGLIRVNGAQLYVRSIGEGVPVVLVHGGPGLDHGYFLPSMRRLAETHRLILYDHRGSGRSGLVAPAGMRMRDFVEDIEGIRKRLRLGKIHLLGHSWGGLVAMQYAIAHQKQLRSLILVSTTGAASRSLAAGGEALQEATTEADKVLQKKITESAAFRKREPAAVAAWYRAVFRPTMARPEQAEALNLYFDERFSVRNANLRGLAADLVEYDLHPALRNVSVPVLLLHGAKEPAPLAPVRELEQTLPDAELHLIEESGHFPFLEAPDMFFRRVLGFLRG